MAGTIPTHSKTAQASTRRDLIVLGTAVATLLALGAVGTYLIDIANHVTRFGAAHGGFVAALLLLNLAITVYGWRRYREAVREVADRTLAEQRAQSLAASDPLTGCLNRRSMNELVAELIERSARRRREVAMLVIHLEGFKTVNDLHGRLTGDNFLRMAAEVIRAALPGDGVVARLGGDQFAAAFSFGVGNGLEAQSVAEAIVGRLGRPFDLGGVQIHLSASAGIADADGSDIDSLVRRADIAVEAAREAGRGRVSRFDESMRRALHDRNELEASLRAGMLAGEFVPYFEPQIDLVSGALQGFEMLARWRHPGRGLVAPDEFISIAEECGLIGELSLAVMRQAMLEAREWDNGLTLSVNISPIQLKDPWLAQKIAKLLNETGFPAERLEVEITESSLLENLGLAQAIVSSLKNQGIRLALDDFGTGYSALAHLRALPFDRIKIDRSFVGSINHSPESAAIVTAITRLAESLNLAVTAEGIEDDAIEVRLRSIGTYTGQGWLLGKPMPVEDVRALLAGRGLLMATRNYAGQPLAGNVTRIRRTG